MRRQRRRELRSAVVLSLAVLAAFVVLGAVAGHLTLFTALGAPATFVPLVIGASLSIPYTNPALDVAISSRAAAADYTAGRAAQLDSIPTLLARVPQIGSAAVQYGTIELNGLLTQTATIGTVNLATSIVIYDGFAENTTGLNSLDMPMLTLTNATTVTATRQNGPAVSSIVAYCVVSFAGATSVQRGTISWATASATATATITAVAPAKAIVFWCGCQVTNNSSPVNYQWFAYVSLTNGTTVTATRQSAVAATTTTVSFAVVEFP